MGNGANEKLVSDAEIEAIIEKGEAGVGELIAAYDLIEFEYFMSIQPLHSNVTPAVNTSRD